jgi:hypothetical protein
MAEAGSFLANAAARRRTLTAARDALLDRPGTVRRGGPPPPTAPAQDKTSPQQDALAKRPQPPEQAQLPGEPAPAPGQQPQPAGDQLGLDPEQRAEFLGQITSFLDQMKAERRAELHPSVGRVRRFFGSG